MKNIDKLWLERKDLLDKLYSDTKALIKWRLPMYRKIGYWEKVFDVFLKQLIEQDEKIDKLIKS